MREALMHGDTRGHIERLTNIPDTGSAAVCTHAWRTHVLQRLVAHAGQSTEHSTPEMEQQLSLLTNQEGKPLPQRSYFQSSLHF